MQDPQSLGLIELTGLLSAVGAASMALVEAAKVTVLGNAGLEKVKQCLGDEAVDALGVVYGAKTLELHLRGAWRKGGNELETTLGSGLRLAVFSLADSNGSGTPNKSDESTRLEDFVRGFGEGEPLKLKEAITLLRSVDPSAMSTPELSEARARLARFEASVDARVRAAVAIGNDRYKYTMHIAAGLLCMAACGYFAHAAGESLLRGVLLGLVAVPIAPVAKDVTTFLTSVRDVFKNKASAG